MTGGCQRVPVPGWSAYEVDDAGVIWSVRSGKPLAPGISSNGYLSVSLNQAGRRLTRFVHAIVAEAFIGPRPESADVRHLDGDKTNNRPQNLLYGSRRENMLDAVQHGTHWPSCRATCVNGHAYSQESTFVDRRSGRTARVCKICRRERQREYRERKRHVSG